MGMARTMHVVYASMLACGWVVGGGTSQCMHVALLSCYMHVVCRSRNGSTRPLGAAPMHQLARVMRVSDCVSVLGVAAAVGQRDLPLLLRSK
jgi:hypothetical protein